MFERTDDEIEQMLLHELFHILSRHAPDVRQDLYALIGFFACGPLEYPPELGFRKLTNPDTPVLAHCINVQSEFGVYPMIPVTFAKQPFSIAAGTNPFDYVELQLLGVEDNASGSLPLYLQGELWFTDPMQSQSFLQQVGFNTQYIVHPDEILADNFVFAVRGDPVQTPGLPAAIRARFAVLEFVAPQPFDAIGESLGRTVPTLQEVVHAPGLEAVFRVQSLLLAIQDVFEALS